jgi:Mrp family chromosome partitioning ATPase
LVIEGAADGLVLVVRPRYTPKLELQETLALLAERQIPFLGAVVNASFVVEGDTGPLEEAAPAFSSNLSQVR